jgi:hypothetical protein
MPQDNLQSSARTSELKSSTDWVIVLDHGAIGLTTFSLAMLVIQLVFAGEPFRRGHSILLVAAWLDLWFMSAQVAFFSGRGMQEL